MEIIEQSKLKKMLECANDKHIAVIGDVMLDQYYWGEVSRVSPEAPVPVVDIDNETYHLGGAANVAQNLVSLGVSPILCGLLGNDNRGKRFIEICDSMNIASNGLYIDNDRITTVKTRIIGNNQQIVRLDREVRTPISKEGEEFIFNQITNLHSIDAIIFEDYDKGTISKDLISLIIRFSKNNHIPVFVDPKKNNFVNFSGATLFKPNRKETEVGLNLKLQTKEQVYEAGNILLNKYNMENVLITLGADGMVLFEKNGSITSIPTIARKVSDVSGAGDTAIATLATIYIAGASLADAAKIANIASGLVCEKPGIVAVTKDELIGRTKFIEIENSNT